MTRWDQFRNVPIVGAPYEAYDVVVSVIVKCNCVPDNKPFILTSKTQMACSGCRKVYGIEPVTAKVSLVGTLPAPDSGVDSPAPPVV